MEFITNSKFITINKRYIKLYGLEEAIIISELKNELEANIKFSAISIDDWFCSTVENLEENTGLGEYKQRKALRHLEELGIIETKLKGVPARRFIKLNEKIL